MMAEVHRDFVQRRFAQLRAEAEAGTAPEGPALVANVEPIRASSGEFDWGSPNRLRGLGSQVTKLAKKVVSINEPQPKQPEAHELRQLKQRGEADFNELLEQAAYTQAYLEYAQYHHADDLELQDLTQTVVEAINIVGLDYIGAIYKRAAQIQTELIKQDKAKE